MRLLTNPRILNEEYYGTNNELKKAEMALNKLKILIDEKGAKADIPATEEYTVLKEALCKVFGFHDLLINAGMFYNDAIFTIPIYLSPDFAINTMKDSSYITKNEYGICFSPDAAVVASINLDFAVMSNKGANLSGKEMLAIILHEVGHNFFSTDRKTTLLLMLNFVRGLFIDVIANINNPEAYPVLVQQLIQTLIRTNRFSNTIFAKISNAMLAITKDMWIRKIFISTTQFIRLAASEFLAVIPVIIGLFCFPTMWMIQYTNMAIISLFNLISFGWLDTLYVGYDNEKFSDNFASTYGYGPELASSLTKLEEYGSKGHSQTLRKIVESDKSGSLNFAACLYAIPLMTVSHMLLDCHPTTEQRLLGQIKMLKTELKKQNLKPSTKKMILADLNRLEKLEHEYFDASDRDNGYLQWRKQESRNRKAYGGDYREVIRGEFNKENAKEWNQFEIAAANAKTKPLKKK